MEESQIPKGVQMADNATIQSVIVGGKNVFTESRNAVRPRPELLERNCTISKLPGGTEGEMYQPYIIKWNDGVDQERVVHVHVKSPVFAKLDAMTRGRDPGDAIWADVDIEAPDMYGREVVSEVRELPVLDKTQTMEKFTTLWTRYVDGTPTSEEVVVPEAWHKSAMSQIRTSMVEAQAGILYEAVESPQVGEDLMEGVRGGMLWRLEQERESIETDREDVANGMASYVTRGSFGSLPKELLDKMGVAFLTLAVPPSETHQALSAERDELHKQIQSYGLTKEIEMRMIEIEASPDYRKYSHAESLWAQLERTEDNDESLEGTYEYLESYNVSREEATNIVDTYLSMSRAERMVFKEGMSQGTLSNINLYINRATVANTVKAGLSNGDAAKETLAGVWFHGQDVDKMEILAAKCQKNKDLHVVPKEIEAELEVLRNETGRKEMSLAELADVVAHYKRGTAARYMGAGDEMGEFRRALGIASTKVIQLDNARKKVDLIEGQVGNVVNFEDIIDDGIYTANVTSARQVSEYRMGGFNAMNEKELKELTCFYARQGAQDYLAERGFANAITEHVELYSPEGVQDGLKHKITCMDPYLFDVLPDGTPELRDGADTLLRERGRQGAGKLLAQIANQKHGRVKTEGMALSESWASKCRSYVHDAKRNQGKEGFDAVMSAVTRTTVEAHHSAKEHLLYQDHVTFDTIVQREQRVRQDTINARNAMMSLGIAATSRILEKSFDV